MEKSTAAQIASPHCNADLGSQTGSNTTCYTVQVYKNENKVNPKKSTRHQVVLTPIRRKARCCFLISSNDRLGEGLQLNKKKNRNKIAGKKKKKPTRNTASSQTGHGDTGISVTCWNPHLLSSYSQMPADTDRTAASSDRNWRSGRRLFSNHRRYGTDDKARKANKKNGQQRRLAHLPIW